MYFYFKILFLARCFYIQIYYLSSNNSSIIFILDVFIGLNPRFYKDGMWLRAKSKENGVAEGQCFGMKSLQARTDDQEGFVLLPTAELFICPPEESERPEVIVTRKKLWFFVVAPKFNKNKIFFINVYYFSLIFFIILAATYCLSSTAGFIFQGTTRYSILRTYIPT